MIPMTIQPDCSDAVLQSFLQGLSVQGQTRKLTDSVILLQGSLMIDLDSRIVAPCPGGQATVVRGRIVTDSPGIGGATPVLLSGPDADHVISLLRRRPRALQAAIAGSLAGGMAVAEELKLYEGRTVVEGLNNVTLRGDLSVEHIEQIPLRHTCERMVTTVIWGTVITNGGLIPGDTHWVQFAGEKAALVLAAARRWQECRLTGALRMLVRGALRSQRDRSFVEAKYVEFFGLPKANGSC